MSYFKIEEFECSCCGDNDMDLDFLCRLTNARKFAGIPFYINSGYRCETHNKNVGGSSTSSHLKGVACDIKCDCSGKREKIISALIKAGFNRIGVSKTFIHVDSDSDKNPSIWVY